MTIPGELRDEIGADTAERAGDRLLELVNWLEGRYGPVTEEERAAALRELQALDIEHERRRAGS